MRIKIFVLLFGVTIFLTGCSVEYEIKINKDLTVDEKIYAVNSDDFFESYPLSSKDEVIDFILEPQIEYLNSNNYNFEKKIRYNESGVLVNGGHATIENYIMNSNAYKQFYEKLSYTQEGNIHTVKNETPFLEYNENDPERFMVENATISIKIPYKVISNNADEVDASKGIYKWNFEKETTNKNLLISFDESKINIDYFQYFKLLFFAIPFVLVALIFYFMKIKYLNNNKL